MIHRCLALASLASLAGVVAPARAATIPYPTPGAENAVTYTFTATNTGSIVAYFAGTGAAYNETLGMLVNGVSTGITGLNNHTSAYGTALDLGNVTAGDNIVFTLFVQETGATWSSVPAQNSDGANHVYSTAFAGDAFIPAGTYVGFEDLPRFGDSTFPQSDFNYTDEQFVFANVTATPVPLPPSAWLLLTGLVGLVAVSRRRAPQRAL